MNAKKFVAPTMREALQQVKKELGDGAIILKSDKVPKNGLFDFLKGDMVEVTAAPGEDMASIKAAGPDFAQHLDSSLAQREENGPERRAHYELEVIKDEVRSLRESLAEISLNLKYSKMPVLPPELSKAYTRLEESGMEERWVQDLVGQALVELAANELVSTPDIDRYLAAQVSGVFTAPVPTRSTPRGPVSLAFVGPAGSGKTTMLMKLATHPQYYGKRQVGVITCDSRRLAAIEQIRTFARLSGISLEVVYNAEQMSAARHRLRSKEVILVDTPGCNPRDEKSIERLHELMEKADCHEIHLVISAATRDRELMLTCEKYRAIPYSHLIFTHTDETTQYGAMANIVRQVSKPISFIGSGPTIPEDMERPEPQRIAKWILESSQGSSIAQGESL
jgi:flagellar biosynthesis protein FlhF